MSKNTWKVILYITFATVAGTLLGYLHGGAKGMEDGMLIGLVVGVCLVFFSWIFTEGV